MGAREAQPPPEPPAGHRLVDAPPEGSAGPEATIPPDALDQSPLRQTVAAGPKPEPLSRLGNYAAVGVCTVAAYEILFFVVALFVVFSGSLSGVVILNILYLAFFLLLAVAGIPFIAWFYRAYKNLPLLDVKPRFSPGMAIACWLIPFANWVLPGMIGDELWKAGRSPDQPQRADGWNLARVWWGAYIGVGLFGLFSLLLLGLVAGSARTFAMWVILTSSMLIVSAGLAIVFVRRASERLDALAGHASAGGDLDRAIASIYETLPVPDSLTEESPGMQPTGGAPVPPAPHATGAPQTDAMTFCTRCGAPEEGGANFCGSCGASLR